MSITDPAPSVLEGVEAFWNSPVASGAGVDVGAGFQHPIDRRTADLERDFRSAAPLRLHCSHLGGVYRSRAAPLTLSPISGVREETGFAEDCVVGLAGTRTYNQAIMSAAPRQPGFVVGPDADRTMIGVTHTSFLRFRTCHRVRPDLAIYAWRGLSAIAPAQFLRGLTAAERIGKPSFIA